jgi:two-component system sensor histidine kinase AdeS
MKRLLGGLGRQIALTMMAATVASVMLAIFILYLFYGIVLRIAPGLMPMTNAWLPNGIEWVLILALCVAAAGLGGFVALRLAGRIIPPLVSVAESARRIVDGDTKARAVSSDRSLSEAVMLVDDFNLLAERLDRASEAVTRWNATIAHELRTPVTILSGRLQGLADGVFEPDPRLLRSLVSQVDALARLIEDLRTVSLFEGGRLSISVQPVALSEEIEMIVRLMQPQLEEAGFSVTLMLDRGICGVDVARIRQALLSLLENVRRHADPAPISVMLTLEGKTARLSVADKGPGLTPDFAQYAFEPFRRYMEEDEPTKGSGLGLAVVMAIARAHGGTASYETMNGGACFSIIIPRDGPA